MSLQILQTLDVFHTTNGAQNKNEPLRSNVYILDGLAVRPVPAMHSFTVLAFTMFPSYRVALFRLPKGSARLLGFSPAECVFIINIHSLISFVDKGDVAPRPRLAGCRFGADGVSVNKLSGINYLHVQP